MKHIELKDYSSTMWRWLLEWSIHPEHSEGEGWKHDHLVTAMDYLISDQVESAEMYGRINRAIMAFNLMMNHYEGYISDESIREGKIVGPTVDHLMHDMPMLANAFKLWVYG